MRHCFNVFQRTILQRTSIEVNVYNATSSNALFCTHYVNNVIYHKFSHSDVSYRFNGNNVNVMLQFNFLYVYLFSCIYMVKNFVHSSMNKNLPAEKVHLVFYIAIFGNTT